jgi:hypothetical protein
MTSRIALHADPSALCQAAQLLQFVQSAVSRGPRNLCKFVTDIKFRTFHT